MKEPNFNFSQAVLSEYGSETAEYLKEDLPAFTDFDPDLIASGMKETGKGGRTLTTDQRITLLNSIYAVLMEFNHASKIVFDDDPVRRERYELPSNDSPDDDDDE